MRSTITLTPAVDSPSLAVQEAIDAIATLLPQLAKTVSNDGGVVVSGLRETLRPVVEGIGFRGAGEAAFAPSAISWTDPGRGAAVSVHGGRAHTNNEVLLAVLSAAASRGVDWLIVVVPSRYKGGPTSSRVVEQLTALSRAPGIDLDLVGVTVLAF